MVTKVELRPLSDGQKILSLSKFQRFFLQIVQLILIDRTDEVTSNGRKIKTKPCVIFLLKIKNYILKSKKNLSN